MATTVSPASVAPAQGQAAPAAPLPLKKDPRYQALRNFALSITVFNAPADQAALAPYREAGIQRVLLEVPDVSRDEILRVLDKASALVKA